MPQAHETERKAVDLPSALDRHRILSVEQMATGLGLSIAHLRRLYRTGKVPKPLKIGARKLGWPAGVLIDLASLPANDGQAA